MEPEPFSEKRPVLEKGPDAFRTISEVADDLGLPQHVLRFWETRFPQIKPIKRGGGRRYYRPNDVDLLRGIKHLLYGEGYTIRGVQRILREQGHRRVAAYVDGGAPAPDPSDSENGDATEPAFGLMSAAAGPELWAPQRRPPGVQDEQRGDAPSPVQDDFTSEDDDPSPQIPEPVCATLTAVQVRRLRTALHELDACRRLLHKRH